MKKVMLLLFSFSCVAGMGKKSYKVKRTRRTSFVEEQSVFDRAPSEDMKVNAKSSSRGKYNILVAFGKLFSCSCCNKGAGNGSK